MIRPHGEEARARRGGFQTAPTKKARAPSNLRAGPRIHLIPSRRITQSAFADCVMLVRMRWTQPWYAMTRYPDYGGDHAYSCFHRTRAFPRRRECIRLG